MSEQSLNSRASKPLFARVLKNSSFNLIGWVIPAVINLVTVPFYIHMLSAEGYGIWLILGSITGYLSLVQFGLGPAITKYVASYSGQNNQSDLIGSINAGLLYSSIIGAISALVISIFSYKLLHLFNIQSSPTQNFVWVVYLVGITFLFVLLNNVLSAAFDGMQRFDVSNQFTLGISIVSIIISIALVLSGFGILGMAIGSLTSNLIGFLLGLLLLRKLQPNYSFQFSQVKRALPTIFRFSTFAFVMQIARVFTSRLPELVITIILGPAYVTYFTVPTRLITLLSTGISSIASVLFPLSSELHAKGDHSQLFQSYILSQKYLILFCTPFYVISAVFAREILMIWLGKDFAEQSWLVLTIASCTYLVSLLTIVPSHFLLGQGYVRFIASFSVGVAIISSALIIPLTSRFGILGTAFSVLSTQAVGLLYFLYSNRKLGLTMAKWLKTIGPGLFVPLIVSVIFIPLRMETTSVSIVHKAIFVLFYFVSCGVIIWFTPGMIDSSLHRHALILLNPLHKLFEQMKVKSS